MSNKDISDKKVFVSFIDENGKEIRGMFFLIKEEKNYIKISSGKNIIIVPYHKLNKLKGGSNKI